MAVAKSSKTQLRVQYRRGLRAFRNNDFSAAARTWLRVVRQRPSASLWARVGLAFERDQKETKATTAYRKALALKPGHSRAKAGLARLHIAPPTPPLPLAPVKPTDPPPKNTPGATATQEVARRIQASEDLLNKIQVTPAPRKAEQAWSSAHQLRGLAQFSRALLAFVKAYSLGYTRSEVDYYLGRTCLEDELIPSALLHLQRAQRAVPEDQGIYLQLGKAYGLLGDSERQVSSFETALSLDPLFGEAHYLAALAYDAQGVSEKVVEHTQKAIRLEPKYRALLKRGLKNGIVVRSLGERVRTSLKQDRPLNPTDIDGYAAQVAQLLYGESPLGGDISAPQTQGDAEDAYSVDEFMEAPQEDRENAETRESILAVSPEKAPGANLSQGTRSKVQTPLSGAPPPPPKRSSRRPFGGSLSGPFPQKASFPTQKAIGRKRPSSPPLPFRLLHEIFKDLHAGKGRRAFEHVPHQQRAAFLSTLLTKLRQSPSLDPIRMRVEAALRE
jgi:tetratricopeptide (TPR) repeat protein